MKVLHSCFSKLLGRNLESTPSQVIVDQLNEPRPLPMGRNDFEEWSNRLIAGAMLPTSHIKTQEELNIFFDSQKCTLAGMIMHLGPTESHKPDAFFIHSLRKGVSNQVAHEIGMEYRQKAKERLVKKETDEKSIPDSPAL